MSDTASSLQRDQRSALNCKKILLAWQALFLLFTLVLWNRQMLLLRLIVYGGTQIMYHTMINRFMEYNHGWNFWNKWTVLTGGGVALGLIIRQAIRLVSSESGDEYFVPLLFTLVTESMFPAVWWCIAHALQVIQQKQGQT